MAHIAHRVITSSMTLAFALSLVTHGAFAHSPVQGTKPLDGAVLSAAPDSIDIVFSVPTRVTLISLTDQNGNSHGLTRLDDLKPVTAFSATAPSLPGGRYRVEWRGLAEDGHPMKGNFAFQVTE